VDRLDVPVSHVIGTVALILLVASVASYFVMTVSHVHAEILRQQLKEVANYISANLMEIIALLHFIDILYNTTMFKVINLPPDISGYLYVVEVGGEEAYKKGAQIRLYLLSKSDVEVFLRLPLETVGTSIKLFTVNDGATSLLARNGLIRPSGRLYSSHNNIVVWGWKENATSIWAGIGFLEAKDNATYI